MTARRALLALAAITIFAYAPIWSAGWVYDDRNWAPLLVRQPPLGWSVLHLFQIADGIGHAEPWAYHGLVLIAHLVNGVLLWGLLQAVTSERVAVIAVGMFWLHPFQVPAVAYVTGGREVVITTAVLAAVLLTRSGTWWRLGLAALLTTVAAGAKWSAVPVLVLVPLGAVLVGADRRSVGALRPFWPIAVALIAITRPAVLRWAVQRPPSGLFAWQTAGAGLSDLGSLIGLSWVAGIALVALVVAVRPVAAVWLLVPMVARALVPQPGLQVLVTPPQLYLPFLVVWPVLAGGLVAVGSRLTQRHSVQGVCYG